MKVKKLLALLLTLVMLVGLIPAIPAYAAEEELLEEVAPPQGLADPDELYLVEDNAPRPAPGVIGPAPHPHLIVHGQNRAVSTCTSPGAAATRTPKKISQPRHTAPTGF